MKLLSMLLFSSKSYALPRVQEFIYESQVSPSPSCSPCDVRADASFRSPSAA